MIAKKPGDIVSMGYLLQMSREGRKEFLAATLREYAQRKNLTDVQLFQSINTSSTGFLSKVELETFFKTMSDKNNEYLFPGFDANELGQDVHDEVCKRLLKPKGSTLVYSDFIELLFEDVAHDQIIFRYQNADSTPQQFYTINLNWNLTVSGSDTMPVTAYNTNPEYDNSTDRPRINTFRSDGTNTTFLSVGSAYETPVTHGLSATPWGDRATLSKTIQIPYRQGYTAGVDVFTVDWRPAMDSYPTISNWTFKRTGNPTEVQYQYVFKDPGEYNINVNLFTQADPQY